MKKGLLTLLFSLLYIILLSNEPVSYRLVNSDRLNINRSNDEYITQLRGNVHFFYNDIEFKANMADIFEMQQIVTLKENVVIIQDTLNITCEDAVYDHKNQYLRMHTNVVITEVHDTETLRKITSNRATHHIDSGEFILQGNVFAADLIDDIFARAGFAIFNQETGYGYMIERPVVWRAGADSLALYAEKIEYFEDTNRIIASYDVLTQNSDIEVKSDFLIYYGDENRIVYIGDPKFYSENGDGNADLITVFLEDNDIKEIQMEGNCFIEFSSNDNQIKENWINSDYMNLFYQNNNPKKFIARDNVNAFMVQNTQQRRNNMDNVVSGDLLNIIFNEDTNIEHLRINNSVRGKYRFERK